MKGIDLSKFKKVDANRDHTIMESPEGHKVYLAHKTLTKEMHDALRKLPIQKLAKGGVVQRPTPQAPGSDEERKKVQDSFNSAMGFKKMNDGGEVGVDGEDVIPEAQSNNLPTDTGPVGQMVGRAMAAGHGGAPFNPEAQTPPRQLATDNLEAVSEETPTPELTPAVPPAPLSMGSTSQSIPGQDITMQGFGNVEAGLKGAADAEQKAHTEMAAKADAGVKALEKNLYQSQQKQQAIMQQNDQITQQLASQDPREYTANHSLGNRIASAIGIMLGGGLVVGAINQWIDQDVEDQQTLRSNKETLFKMNQQRLGDEKAAGDMTRLNMLSMVELQMKQAAEKGLSAAAQPNYLKNLGQVQLEKSKLIKDIEMKQNAMQAIGSSKEMNPQQVGQAIRAVVPEGQQAEAFKELGHLQSAQVARQQVSQNFDEIRKLNAALVSIPLTESKAQFSSNQASLLSNVVKSLGSNPSDRDMKTVNQMIPSWSDMVSPRREAIINTKAKLLQEFVDSKQKQTLPTPLLDSLGIRLNSPAKVSPKR